ncbi:MAG: NAD-dependent epimerase/dehydratase family protein [Candidatus Bathyarchaeota archaeon]|nr:NAD-dependent epimerase/dehydratase family protein [Candidatus Bathyarchaeota archaeon]
MSALVTGGAGFIGSHLVDSLICKGFHVRVVDNLSSGKIANIERWLSDEHFEFVEGDLKDQSICSKSVEGVEVVFHLAANPDVRLGEIDPSTHFRENLFATYNVLEAMRRSENAERIVFASTSTIYGEADVFPTPEDYGPLLPISIYGAAKLGCEALISSYAHTFGFSGVLLRFANVVGARMEHGVIVDFVKKLEQNPSVLEILGDGKQKKSYLHVKDLVDAFFAVLPCLERAGRVEAFNAGSLDWVDVKRIAEIVCEEMGIKPEFRFNNALGDGRGWKGDVRTMRLSVERLVELGWKPKLNSEDAVRQSCRELLQ